MLSRVSFVTRKYLSSLTLVNIQGKRFYKRFFVTRSSVFVLRHTTSLQNEEDQISKSQRRDRDKKFVSTRQLYNVSDN